MIMLVKDYHNNYGKILHNYIYQELWSYVSDKLSFRDKQNILGLLYMWHNTLSYTPYNEYISVSQTTMYYITQLELSRAHIYPTRA